MIPPITPFQAAIPLPNIGDLTLEEKVGQLMLTNFDGSTVNADATRLIRELKIGGIIYFERYNALSSPEQVRELSANLQGLAKGNSAPIPLMITLDQEGGLVARLRDGFTAFPGNRALAIAGDPTLAEASARVMGEELRSVGVNLNLAPVVDIDSNPENPVIGMRSFGPTPEIVSRFAREALKGFRSAGMLTTLKHFPGHGDTSKDSHVDLPVLAKSKEHIKTFEVRPFADLAAHTDAVMTAHLMVPAIDEANCSTLSASCLKLLREDVGFDGAVITDCLTMKGVLKNADSMQNAALRAMQAGCDLLLFGHVNVGEVRAMHTFLMQSVQKGHLLESRIDQSIERIFRLKGRIASNKHVIVPDEQEMRSLVKERKALALQIATRALRIQYLHHFTIPPLPALEKSDCAIIASSFVQRAIEGTSICQIGRCRQLHFFKGLHPIDERTRELQHVAARAQVVVFLSLNAWKSEAQAGLIRQLLNLHKPLVLIALGNEADIPKFPEAHLSIRAFSPTSSSIEAAGSYLLQHC